MRRWTIIAGVAIAILLAIGIVVRLVVGCERARRLAVTPEDRAAVITLIELCDGADRSLADTYRRGASHLPEYLATDLSRALTVLRDVIAPIFYADEQACSGAAAAIVDYQRRAPDPDATLATAAPRIAEHEARLDRGHQALLELIAATEQRAPTDARLDALGAAMR